MHLVALIGILSLLWGCATGSDETVAPAMVDASSASQPMSVSTSRPQPVDASTDIVNVFARSELAIGMVMEIHITPDGPNSCASE